MTTDFDASRFFEDFNNNCNKVNKRSFKKGEVITTYIEKRNQMWKFYIPPIQIMNYL